ncbi:MAG: purine-nucleoside phosphorylase, partial [Flavobacteriales bacterium]
MKKQQLIVTTDFLKTKGFTNPTVGIVLGTGLGNLVNEVDIEVEI